MRNAPARTNQAKTSYLEILETCTDPEGGGRQGIRISPTEKSQKYRVS